MTEPQIWYDRQARPVSIEQWSELHQDKDYCRIALDGTADGDITVSTVWIGISTSIDNLLHSGAPLIFETMVFGGPRDEEQWRWATEAEARAGHAEICSAVLR